MYMYFVALINILDMELTMRIVLLLGVVIPLAWGHGRMTIPPGRGTMWKYGYDNPPNYCDHCLECDNTPVGFVTPVRQTTC